MASREVLAIIGGGRWASVYLSVLGTMQLPFSVAVVAQHAAEKLEGLRDSGGQPIAVFHDLEALLAGSAVVGAIVVNAAAAHAPVCLRLLENGVAVLVEKPAATDGASARKMAEMADERGVALMPALTYLNCSYLHHFAQAVHAQGVSPSTLRLDWADPIAEARYGTLKQYDRGVGLAMDVVPHVWSIIASVLGPCAIQVGRCDMDRGGHRITLRLLAGDVACDVVLEREAAQRRRFLATGEQTTIDFAEEPGIIKAGGVSLSGDPQWQTRTDKPVRRQVEAFLRAIGHPASSRALHELQASVELAQACDALVKGQQAQLLAATRTDVFSADIECAVTELLAQRAAVDGSLVPGDRQGLERRVLALREAVGQEPADDWLQAVAQRAQSS